MSYIVKWASSDDSGGKDAITIADKTQDVLSTSLTLTGKGLNDYGQIQQQNFIRLLENFARDEAPDNATVGQLWFNTTDKLMYVYTGEGPYDGWDHLGGGGGGVSAGLAEYGSTPDASVTGMATRLNRIIGTPIYSGDYTTAYGWGQTDLVPTYDSDGNLDSDSEAAEADLPGGNTFPPVFNNEAWAIFISRLRKAMRHAGLDETDTSPVGFINDNRPVSPGNLLANLYNAFPTHGTMANISAGWGGAGANTVNGYFQATEDALDELETNRFDLNLSTPVIICTAEREDPAFDTYKHVIEVKFTGTTSAEAKLKAQSFFNSGGTLKFNWAFDPDGSSDAETGWEAFLDHFNNLTFNHRGMLLGTEYQAYNTQNDDDPYEFVTRGFYDVIDHTDDTGDGLPLFERDAEDYGPDGAYDANTFPNGGIRLRAYSKTSGNDYIITFTITYEIDEFDGSDDANDTLDGTLTSEIVAHCPVTANLDSPTITIDPLDPLTGSGTFVS